MTVPWLDTPVPVAGLRPRRGAMVLSLLAAVLLGACSGAGGSDGVRAEDGETVPGSAPASQQSTADGSPRVDPQSGGVTRETTIQVAGIPIVVEIADDAETRRRGLMFRDSLPEGRGMLFVYPQEQTLSFWMRNTPLPLDIAFISRDGVIVDIQQMEPQSDSTHLSREPAMYALELQAGWFAENQVAAGDRVVF